MFDQDQKTAAALIIGNEILSGRTADVNIVAIAKRMAARGIIFSEVRIVPDQEAKVIEALNALRKNYTYVITTGGIGPTHDDITIPCIAKAFGVGLEERAEALASLTAFYGEENMNPPRRRMALMPVGATLVTNPVTAAPTLQMDNVFALAGVPEIMRGMLDAVLDKLDQGRQVYIRTVRCMGVVESLIADELTALAIEEPEVDIGSYPSFYKGQMGLALVIRGYEPEMVTSVSSRAADLLQAKGGRPQIIEGY